MKKKYLKILVSLGIIATAFTGVSATTTSINHSVPTAQGYKYLSTKNKSSKTNYGTVILTKKEPDAVTFSAKADGGSYGDGTVVYNKNTVYNVNYTGTYGSGTPMTARFRNHNWSLNSNMITGTFDYK